MRIELKKAIIDFIFENHNVFNLVNHTTAHFKEYVYNSKGEYLIGGEEVYQFINIAIDLITSK